MRLHRYRSILSISETGTLETPRKRKSKCNTQYLNSGLFSSLIFHSTKKTELILSLKNPIN